jgi:hypothetical protein
MNIIFNKFYFIKTFIEIDHSDSLWKVFFIISTIKTTNH